MAEQQQQQSGPGGFYSGQNKIPNIKEFVQNLDKEKAQRDKELDERKRANENARAHGEEVPPEAQDHQVHEMGVKGTQKQVTDPTTGRQVVIEDVNKETMENVKDPMVCWKGLLTAADLQLILTNSSRSPMPT